MSYIERDMSEMLKNAHKVFPVVTLTGPRQSGKTTLCRHIYPDMPYVNFENIQTCQLFQENPVGFIDSYASGAVFDEAQLQTGLFRALQTVVDEDAHKRNGRRFIVTGSSNFAVMAKSAESMAGRTAVLTLLPLSINEILGSQKEPISTNELIFRGGYPKIWVSPSSAVDMILQSYIDTYVERDLRQLLNIKDLNKFVKFLGLCAGRVGTELNRSSLAVETGISVATVDAWLSVLEASYVIWMLKPWSTNLNKRLTKSSKIYFCDTGLLCNLLGLQHYNQLEYHPLRGAFFENLVVNEFLKSSFNKGLRARLSFFRDKTGREIDLVQETPEGLRLFEIKASTGFNPDYFRHIRYFEKTYPEKVISSTVIYDGRERSDFPMSRLCNFRDSAVYNPMS